MRRNCYYFLSIYIGLCSVSACSATEHPSKLDGKEKYVIEIISMTRVEDLNRDPEVCADFLLTNQEVVQYFLKSEKVDGFTFHHESIILPCKYQGELNRNGEVFNWEIIAGGTGFLYNDQNDGEIFLCRGERCCSQFDTLC